MATKQRNKVSIRTERTMMRLEAQLESGVKVIPACKSVEGLPFTTSLTDGDIKRIQREIDVLKGRI